MNRNARRRIREYKEKERDKNRPELTEEERQKAREAIQRTMRLYNALGLRDNPFSGLFLRF